MLKESIYNNVIIDNQQTYIYNSLTKARILLENEEEFSKIITDIKEGNAIGSACFKELQMLIDNGFLVEDSIDEQEVLKYIFYKRFFESDKFGLILMPTLRCNFNCPYCFEKSSKNLIFEENSDYFEVIYRFIAKNIQRYRHCHLNFFGGEPLLQKNQISGFALKFTRLAQDAKLSFDSSMVTNGSLIDEGVIQTLKILNTRLLQVTIDGGKVQHDQTRCYMNGEPSFDLIIAKIIQVVRAMDKDGICFLIRFNLNSSSIDEVESSLNVIPSSLRRRIHVMFRPIFSTPLYHVNNKTTYDDLDGFNSVASEMGFLIYKNKRMFLSCEACGDKNFFHVLPDLSLWKCINDFSFQEARIGQMLKDGSIKWNVQRINNWFKNADFFNDEKCKGCSVAPDCLGGCIRQYAITKKRRCGSCKSLSSAYKYR